MLIKLHKKFIIVLLGLEKGNKWTFHKHNISGCFILNTAMTAQLNKVRIGDLSESVRPCKGSVYTMESFRLPFITQMSNCYVIIWHP